MIQGKGKSHVRIDIVVSSRLSVGCIVLHVCILAVLLSSVGRIMVCRFSSEMDEMDDDGLELVLL